MTFKKHLEKLRKIQRKKHHPLIHHLHKEHKISRKTLFYVKEYGPHSHVSRTIVKESLKIIFFASILSSLGGLALESIKTLFVSFIPLVILLPILNDLIGDFGTIFSSHFSTLLHEGKIKRRWWLNPTLKKILAQIFVLAILMAFLSAALAFIISRFSGYLPPFYLGMKILLVTVLDVVLLTGILVLVSALAGLYFYRRKEDPNNFLIPLTTSLADLGNMMVLALLVVLFF